MRRSRRSLAGNGRAANSGRTAGPRRRAVALFQLRPAVAELLDPVRIEQSGRGRTIGQREGLAGGPAAVRQIGLEPVIGDVKVLPALFRAERIALAFGA